MTVAQPAAAPHRRDRTEAFARLRKRRRPWWILVLLAVLIAAGVERSSAPSARPSPPEPARITAEPIRTGRSIRPAKDGALARTTIPIATGTRTIANTSRTFTNCRLTVSSRS